MQNSFFQGLGPSADSRAPYLGASELRITYVVDYKYVLGSVT